MHVIVIVLGDLGRSPRMQYHCQSLLESGHVVTLIGYTGEHLIPTLMHGDNNHHGGDRFHVIRFSPPLYFQNVNKLLYFIWRFISLTYYLMVALFRQVPKRPVDFVLVQNPPAMPLLLVAYLYVRMKAWSQRGRRPGWIIDWHNLGYSMLPDGSAIQKIAKSYERFLAPKADGHLTVTKAMKGFLKESMNTTKNIEVLYDCPPDMFEPLPVEEQHNVLMRLHKSLIKTCPPSWYTNLSETQQTLLTEELPASGKIQHRPGRPALIISSTSWTPDEDFGLLLSALEVLDDKIDDNSSINDSNNTSLLKLLVVVTGKGPLREMYEKRISRTKFRNVAVATVWVDPADYPKLLACADLGISLHTSTSGLDLPMKILDLFGCGIPVVAHDFACLSELVQDGVNGRVFRGGGGDDGDGTELADLLYELLRPLEKNGNKRSMANHSYGALQAYSQQLQDDGPHPISRWSGNWMEHALPVILRSTPV